MTPLKRLISLLLAACALAVMFTEFERGHFPVRSATSEALPREVQIPNTRQFEFVSRINGHPYSISIAVPFGPPPAAGYGVLYVLDGYCYFASATETVRGLGNTPGVVVVGIGYPDDPSYVQSVLARRGAVPAYLAGLSPLLTAAMLERNYDLTLPADDKDLAAQSFPGTPVQKSGNVGGVDEFLRVIETEVKPRVAALTSIDPNNQVLFGHSFGGLAALHALFTEPNAFRTFIIASPSIWWNNREVLNDEAAFAEAVTSGKAGPRVLITIGGEEDTIPRFPAGWGVEAAAATAFYRRTRMVENGRELVDRLKALHGDPGYLVEDYAVFDKESHSASPWSALARGVPFAFGQQ